MNPAVPESNGARDPNKGGAPPTRTLQPPTPLVPDHELLYAIGHGSYGDVWLAKNKLGTFRAVEVVYRSTFEDSRPFEREFKGIQKFEPISRSHEGLVDILQVGGTQEYFYYVMELADAARNPKSEIRMSKLLLLGVRFGLRVSGFLRISTFGIRICIRLVPFATM